MSCCRIGLAGPLGWLHLRPMLCRLQQGEAPSVTWSSTAMLQGAVLAGCPAQQAHLLHHDRVVALKGDVHVHVVLHGPNLVGCREALAAAALSACLQAHSTCVMAAATCALGSSALRQQAHQVPPVCVTGMLKLTSGTQQPECWHCTDPDLQDLDAAPGCARLEAAGHDMELLPICCRFLGHHEGLQHDIASCPRQHFTAVHSLADVRHPAVNPARQPSHPSASPSALSRGRGCRKQAGPDSMEDLQQPAARALQRWLTRCSA